jgi:hypothetical protein
VKYFEEHSGSGDNHTDEVDRDMSQELELIVLRNRGRNHLRRNAICVQDTISSGICVETVKEIKNVEVELRA